MEINKKAVIAALVTLVIVVAALVVYNKASKKFTWMS